MKNKFKQLSKPLNNDIIIGRLQTTNQYYKR
jgi:hypothetical protein